MRKRCSHRLHLINFDNILTNARFCFGDKFSSPFAIIDSESNNSVSSTLEFSLIFDSFLFFQ